MIKSVYFELFFLISFLLCGIWLGYSISDYKNNQIEQNKYNGIWMYAGDKPDALNTSYHYEPNGHWICVNINNMNVSEMRETCEHEVGHELWASYCQKNMTKCLGALP